MKKKTKKLYKQKTFLSLAETLRNQADKKNNFDRESILNELNDASLDGEYSRTVKIKINQATYIQSLGLKVEDSDRVGYYKISWI